jgi:hypothetical protein
MSGLGGTKTNTKAACGGSPRLWTKTKTKGRQPMGRRNGRHLIDIFADVI